MSLRMLSPCVIETFLLPSSFRSDSTYLYGATAPRKTSPLVVPLSSPSCSNVSFILSLNSTVNFGMFLSPPSVIHQIYPEYPYCQGIFGVSWAPTISKRTLPLLIPPIMKLLVRQLFLRP